MAPSKRTQTHQVSKELERFAYEVGRKLGFSDSQIEKNLDMVTKRRARKIVDLQKRWN